MKLQAQQAAFAARIRDPESHPVPAGIAPERMRVYETLFFNNLDSLLAGNFPVLREVLAGRWPTLVRAFMRLHRCHTPLFFEISREFLDFLNHHGQNLDLPPFAEELAHYEWVELALANADTPVQWRSVNEPDDMLNGIPGLSPLAWLLSYQWPVHRICATHQPRHPLEQPVWLLVWRDRSDEVHFARINETVVWLLQKVDKGRMTGMELASALSSHLGRSDVGALAQYTRNLLYGYWLDGVLTGVEPP